MTTYPALGAPWPLPPTDLPADPIHLDFLQPTDPCPQNVRRVRSSAHGFAGAWQHPGTDEHVVRNGPAQRAVRLPTTQGYPNG